MRLTISACLYLLGAFIGPLRQRDELPLSVFMTALIKDVNNMKTQLEKDQAFSRQSYQSAFVVLQQEI